MKKDFDTHCDNLSETTNNFHDALEKKYKQTKKVHKTLLWEEE